MNQSFNRKNKYQTIAFYVIGVIAVCTVIIKLILNGEATLHLLDSILHILQPFIIGILIAYFLNPLCNFINTRFLSLIWKDKMSKARTLLSILFSYVIVIGLIVTILFFIIPQIVDSLTQITSFVNSAQSGYNELMNYLYKIEKKHPEIDLSIVNEVAKEIPEKILAFLTTAIPKIIPTIYATSMSLISGFLNVLIALIVSIYMLIDKKQLLNNAKRFIYAFLGEQKGDRFLDNASTCNRIFSNFIIGKLIDSLIIGILCFILMSLLKLPYTVILSVIVGVTNMIPYFGPFIGAIPGIVLLLFVDLKFALIFTVMIIALQQFDGLFLGPKILGESTGLRPLWIIFSITVFGAVFGVMGMFLGVPTVAVIAYLLNNLIEEKLGKNGIRFYTNPDTGIINRTLKELPAVVPTEENKTEKG